MVPLDASPETSALCHPPHAQIQLNSNKTLQIRSFSSHPRGEYRDSGNMFICPQQIIQNHSLPYKFNNYCSEIRKEKPANTIIRSKMW